jgi:hypothetical protein
MRHLYIAALLIIGAFTTPACLSGSETGDLIEQHEQGWINWTKGVIMAQGIGSPSEKKTDASQMRATELEAAHQIGWQNILNTANRVRITSGLTVADLVAKEDAIGSKLEDMARASETTKQEYLSDGTVAVTLQLDMNGGFAQLMLPLDIKQIETIKAVTPPDSTAADGTSKITIPGQNPDIYTGLVVDTRGLGALPALAPTIVDETAQEVFGPGIVSREFAVQQGVSGYTGDIESALATKRVRGNPLTVKALRTLDKERSNIVISNADAAKLRSSFEHLKFLKECRVVIVVD